MSCESVSILLNQPLELLEEIFSHIDRPRDLLSLALASRSLSTIIIPHHLDFRDIRCDPQRKGVWASLTQQPNLAKSICCLELIFEVEHQQEGVLIPRTWRALPEFQPVRHLFGTVPKDVDNDCLLALAEAIRCMPRLRRFCWSRGDNPSRCLTQVFEALTETALRLEELQIVNHDTFCSSLEFNRISSPLWEISTLSLSSITIHLSTSVSLGSWFGHKIMNLLFQGCPFLRELYLDTTSRWEISHFLRESDWPLLERLTVGAMIILYPDNIPRTILLEAFFNRHRNLRCLAIGDPDFYIEKISSLANCRCLKAIRIDEMIHDPLHTVFPAEIVRGLEYFEGSISTAGISVLTSMESLRACRLSLRATSIFKFVTSAPKAIERLHIAPARSGFTTQSDYKILHLIEPFTKFQNLTHLGGFLTRVDIYNPASRPLLKPLKSLPNLMYVEMSIRNRVSWIELIRNEQRICVGYKEVDKRQAMHVGCWGEIFRGLDEIY